MSKTLICEVGKHEWEHPGGRGRPPKRCPEHRVLPDAKPSDPDTEPQAKVNPFVKKAQNKAKMEKARQGKEQKKTESAEAKQARLKAELEELPARIRQAEERYTLTREKFSAAQTVEEIEKASRPMEQAQIALAAFYARKRKLDAVEWFEDRGLDATKLISEAESSAEEEPHMPLEEAQALISEAMSPETGEAIDQAHAEMQEAFGSICTDCGENAADPEFEGDEDFGGLCDECAEKLLAAS